MTNFLEALGITDLETFDPRPRWKQTAFSPNFEIPLGFRATEQHKRTNDIILGVVPFPSEYLQLEPTLEGEAGEDVPPEYPKAQVGAKPG